MSVLEVHVQMMLHVSEMSIGKVHDGLSTIYVVGDANTDDAVEGDGDGDSAHGGGGGGDKDAATDDAQVAVL